MIGGKEEEMVCSKKKHIISMMLWGALLVGFGLTRLALLMELPAGLHIDEAGMAYDAWCLSDRKSVV